MTAGCDCPEWNSVLDPMESESASRDMCQYTLTLIPLTPIRTEFRHTTGITPHVSAQQAHLSYGNSLARFVSEATVQTGRSWLLSAGAPSGLGQAAGGRASSGAEALCHDSEDSYEGE